MLAIAPLKSLTPPLFVNHQLTKHHSTSDWDILVASDWSLWTDWLLWGIFISPPTSLYIDPQSYGGDKYALCNLPETLNMKAGRFLTYHRRGMAGVGRTWVYLGVTGPGSTGLKVIIISPVGSWRYSRITWWQDQNLAGLPATKVIRETFIAGSWIPESPIYYDPMFGNVNRVGFGCTTQSLGRWHAFDDTEIWKPC